MITKSIKTSELYIVAFVLAVLLGVQQTAADVARQLQGLDAPQGTAGYWLAAAWLADRTALKARGPGDPYQPVSPAAGTAPADRRHDPYRAWYTPAPTAARPAGAAPDKPTPPQPPPEA